MEDSMFISMCERPKWRGGEAVCGDVGTRGRPESFQKPPEVEPASDQGAESGRRPAPKAPRLAHVDQVAQPQPDAAASHARG